MVVVKMDGALLSTPELTDFRLALKWAAGNGIVMGAKKSLVFEVSGEEVLAPETQDTLEPKGVKCPDITRSEKIEKTRSKS